jgi:hypothetical protein
LEAISRASGAWFDGPDSGGLVRFVVWRETSHMALIFRAIIHLTINVVLRVQRASSRALEIWIHNLAKTTDGTR